MAKEKELKQKVVTKQDAYKAVNEQLAKQVEEDHEIAVKAEKSTASAESEVREAVEEEKED